MDQNEEKIIKRRIEIETSVNGSGIANLQKVRDLAFELVQKNPELAKSYSGISQAVGEATNKQITYEKKAIGAIDKIQAGANRAKFALTGLATTLGMSLTFKGAIEVATAYDKQILNLTNSYRRYGIGTNEIEQRVSSLSKTLKLTKNDTAGLISTFSKQSNFASLTSIESVLTNIRKVVGSDTQAIQQMGAELMSFKEQFPDLEEATNRLNASDQVRIKTQAQLLFVTGQISKAQLEAINEYSTGAGKLGIVEAENQKRLQSTQESMEDMKRVVQDLAITVGEVLKPAFTFVKNIVSDYPNAFKAATVGIVGTATALGVLSTAALGIKSIKNLTGGLFGGGRGRGASPVASAAEGVMSNWKPKGKLGGIAKSLVGSAVGAGAETAENVQKVYVTGGKLDTPGSTISSMTGMMGGTGLGDLTSMLGKGSKVGAGAKVAGAAGEVAAEGAGVLAKVPGISAFAKLAPIISKAIPIIGGLTIAGVGLMSKDKDGKRDYTSAGIDTAAGIAAAFGPIGMGIGAALMGINAVRKAVNDNRIDTNYRSAPKGQFKDDKAVQSDFLSSIKSYGDQFNNNRVKEATMWGQIGSFMDNNTKSLMLLSSVIGPLGPLLVASMTDKPKTAEDDRKNYVASMKKEQQQVVGNLEAKGWSKEAATTYARQNTMGGENMRLNTEKKQIAEKNAPSWYNTKEDGVMNLWGLAQSSEGTLQNKTLKEQGTATRTSNKNSDELLGRKTTEEDRYSLKAGQSFATNADAKSANDTRESARADAQRSMNAAMTGKDSQGNRVDGGALIGQQFSNIDQMRKGMENKVVKDDSTGIGVSIDDASYAKVRQEYDAIGEAAKATNLTEKQSEALAIQQNAKKATLVKMEEARGPILAKIGAVEQAINAQVKINQDRIKATNDLYTAQLSVVNSIVEAQGMIGNKTGQATAAVQDNLNAVVASAAARRQAAEGDLNLVKATETAEKSRRDARLAAIQGEMKTADPTKVAALNNESAELSAQNGASDQKIQAAIKQREAALKQIPIEIAKQEANIASAVNRPAIQYAEQRKSTTGSEAEMAQMGGNVQAASALYTQLAATNKEQADLTKGAQAEVEARLVLAKEALAQAAPGAAREEAQLRINELQNKSSGLVQEQLKYQKGILDANRQQIQANQGNLDLASARVTRMEAELTLMDSLGAGLSASADQRMAVVAQLDRQKALEQDRLDIMDQQIAQYQAQIAAGQNVEAAQAGLLDVETKREQQATSILNTTMKQAQITKSLRDGWVSAVQASVIGAGTFAKFMVTQQKNTSLIVQDLGGIQSMTSGGAFGGYLGSESFSKNGGINRRSSTDGGQLYDTYNGAGRLKDSVAEQRDQALKMATDSAKRVNSADATAFGSNALGRGAALDDAAKGRGTFNRPKVAPVDQKAQAVPGQFAPGAPSGTPAKPDTSATDKMVDVLGDILNTLKSMVTAATGLADPSVPKAAKGRYSPAILNGGMVHGRPEDGDNKLLRMANGETIAVKGGELVMNQNQMTVVARMMGVSPSALADAAKSHDYNRLERPSAQAAEGWGVGVPKATGKKWKVAPKTPKTPKQEKEEYQKEWNEKYLQNLAKSGYALDAQGRIYRPNGSTPPPGTAPAGGTPKRTDPAPSSADAINAVAGTRGDQRLVTTQKDAAVAAPLRAGLQKPAQDRVIPKGTGRDGGSAGDGGGKSVSVALNPTFNIDVSDMTRIGAFITDRVNKAFQDVFNSGEFKRMR